MRAANSWLSAAFVVTSVLPMGLAGQPTQVEGAWWVAEVSGPGPRVVTSPQPGLLLFTGRHYSYTFVTSETPRPPLPVGPTTAEALATIWNPFTANAGTFEISGETMTRRPLVAKDPSSMAPGVFNEYLFHVVADTMWITPTRNETGEARAPSTVRYMRVR
jgi:hypothetical protein